MCPRPIIINYYHPYNVHGFAGLMYLLESNTRLMLMPIFIYQISSDSLSVFYVNLSNRCKTIYYKVMGFAKTDEGNGYFQVDMKHTALYQVITE